MIFAGGRPGIYTVLAFLKQHVQVRISNTEWPAYLDIMTQTETDWRVVPFTRENGFHPPNSAYFDRQGLNAKTHLMPIISNPGNPTGHTRHGAELEELMAMAEQPGNGILLDEAYEMFHESKGVSGIRYVKDLDDSNVFLIKIFLAQFFRQKRAMRGIFRRLDDGAVTGGKNTAHRPKAQIKREIPRHDIANTAQRLIFNACAGTQKPQGEH